MSRLRLLTTTDPVASALGIVVESMQRAYGQRGRCLLSLAGGSTPVPLYERLAEREDLPWQDTEIFWGDERFVPPESEESNQRAVRETLIDHLAVPSEQVHPWPILGSPEASAAAYSRILTRFAGDPPVFDLTLLGLGADCHTASLFPGSGAHRANGLTVASYPDASSSARLSLTATALSRSRTVLFLVIGEEKRAALTSLLANGSPDDCPARAVEALEQLLIVSDLESAG